MTLLGGFILLESRDGAACMWNYKKSHLLSRIPHFYQSLLWSITLAQHLMGDVFSCVTRSSTVYFCSICLSVSPRPLEMCAWSSQETFYHVFPLNFHIHLDSVILYVGMYMCFKVRRNLRCTQGWQGKCPWFLCSYVCYLVYYLVYSKWTIIFPEGMNKCPNWWKCVHLSSHCENISLTHHSSWTIQHRAKLELIGISLNN